MARLHLVALSLTVLFFAGCGQQPKVTLKYDGPEPKGGPIQPTHTQTNQPLVTRPIKPTATVVQPSVTASQPTVVATEAPVVTAPPSPTVKPTTSAPPQTPPRESDFLVFVDFEGGEFFPRVKVLFQKPDGTLVCEDYVSQDGKGISRNLGKVQRGEYYRFRANAEELQVAYFDKVLHITNTTVPRFLLGSVTFKLPKKWARHVNDGMKVRVKKQPLGDVVFDGPFSQARAYSVFGDPFPYMLVLEPGKYTYTVYDVNKDDSVMITDGKGGEGAMPDDACEFVISKEFPKAVLDLSPIFGDATLKKRRFYEPPK